MLPFRSWQFPGFCFTPASTSQATILSLEKYPSCLIFRTYDVQFHERRLSYSFKAGGLPVNVIEQIAKLSQELPPEKQIEVLDFVAFLVARQAPTIRTVEKRQTTTASTMR
jgi:hypothetical protein